MKPVEMLDEKLGATQSRFDAPFIRVFERQYNTPFASQKRFLSLYLRSNWGSTFILDCEAGIKQPRLVNGVLYFPEVISSSDVNSNKHLYRAMAIHLAVHLEYSQNLPALSDYDPVMRALISWVEDARVEQSAMHFIPGIEKQLCEFMIPESQQWVEDSPEFLLHELQQAMFDKRYMMSNEALAEWADRFHQVIVFNRVNSAVSVLLAHELYEIICQRMSGEEMCNALVSVQPKYRDDSSHLFRLSFN